MTRAVELSESEWKLIEQVRAEALAKLHFQRGLEAAALKVERLSLEACGGSGIVTAEHRMLANAIRKIDHKIGY